MARDDNILCTCERKKVEVCGYLCLFGSSSEFLDTNPLFCVHCCVKGMSHNGLKLQQFSFTILEECHLSADMNSACFISVLI